MKKLLVLLLAGALMINLASVKAEEIDFSGYTNDELVHLLSSVQKEITNRHIEKTANLLEGTYTVGKDIPAGLYDITVVYQGSMWMDVYIYENAESENAIHEFTVFAEGNYGNGTGSFHVELKDGNIMKCTAPITITISAGIRFE